MQQTMKKLAILGLGAVLGCSFPDASVLAVPNPVMVHKTYADAANHVGFVPLYLPSVSGYNLSRISTIAHNMAELHFDKQGAPDTTIRLRTAKAAAEFAPSPESISGVYGVEWEKQLTGSGLTVYVGKIGTTEYNAYWEVGNYRFSAYGKQIAYEDFSRLITDVLLDLSSHYYTLSENKLAATTLPKN